AYCRWVLAARVVVVAPQGMAVHDVFGGELAVAVVELHPLVQLDPPGPAIRRQLPAVGQPGLIRAVRCDLDEPLEHPVMLDHVVRGTVDPWPPVVPILL